MMRRIKLLSSFVALLVSGIVGGSPAGAVEGGFGPSVLQSGTAYYGESAFQYLDQSSSFNFIPFDYHTAKPDPMIGAGSITGAFPVGVGATVYANATAGISGSASVANTMSYLWRQDVDTAVIGADTIGSSLVGTPFAIGSLSHISTNSISTGAGVFEANLKAHENFGIGASLKACFGVCVGPDIGFGDGQNGHQETLLAYSSATNTVTAFNQVYQGALPQTFNDPHNLFGVGVYAPDLSGTRAGNGYTASIYTSTTLASAYVNVVGVVAEAYGIPPAVLKDSLLGFNYETVGAYLGAAINVEQTVVMKPLILDKVYHFTSPVERYNSATGEWDYAGMTISLLENEFATVRAPNALNIGLSVENRASFSVDTTLDLSAELQAQLVLLHLYGHDIDISLLNQTYNIASNNSFFRVEDHSTTALQSVYEDAINLSFSLDPATLCPACQSTGVITILVPPPFPAPDPDPGESNLPQTNVSFKVLNFGAPGCDNIVTTSCIRDTSQRPTRNVTRSRVQRVARRSLAGAVGNDSGTDWSAGGFDEFDALAAQSDTEAMTRDELRAANLAMLARVYPGGVRPVLGLTGGVPEPAAWAMLIGGFGLMGGAARRRRAVLA